MEEERLKALEKEVVNLRKSYDEIFSLLRKIFGFLQYTDEVKLLQDAIDLLRGIMDIKEKAVYKFDENGELEISPEFASSDMIQEHFERLKEEGVVEWVMNNDSPFILNDECGVCVLIPMSFRMKPLAVALLIVALNVEDITEQVLSHINLVRYGVAANLANMRLYNEVVRMRDYLFNILANLTNGVVVVARDGSVRLINHTARELFGFGEQDISDKHFFALFSESVSSVLREVMIDAESRGDVVKKEVQMENVKGRSFPVEVTCKPLGNLGSVLFVFRDLSETKEIERIRALDRLKNEFISNVSHDLRTPLTGIKAFAEILLDGLNEMDRREIEDGLRTIKSEVDRLTDMVNELLDFSRLESRMAVLNLKEIDLVELWKSVIKVTESRIKSKNITLSLDFPEEPLLLEGDRDKLYRVLLNLLDNAVKYNEEGGRIWIEVWGDNEKAYFKIGNTGQIIDDADLPYIFDSFFVGRLKINISDARSGIGLAIVKRVVDAHGGSISVVSEQQRGTEFVVSLPRKGRDGNG